MSLKASLFSLFMIVLSPSSSQAANPLIEFDLFPTISYSETWVPPYRALKATLSNGYAIEMDDGSVWNINAGYHKNVKRWESNDYIVFYPCSLSSWNRQKFWAYNPRLRAKAECSLSLGPIQYGPCTNHVQELDFYRGECFLQDGRGYQNLWRISSDDLYRFIKWRINDAVIVGSKNHPDQAPFSSYGYILLNVQENEYVKAEIIY